MKFEMLNKCILTILSIFILIISCLIISTKSYAKYLIEQKIVIGTISILK